MPYHHAEYTTLSAFPLFRRRRARFSFMALDSSPTNLNNSFHFVSIFQVLHRWKIPFPLQSATCSRIFAMPSPFRGSWWWVAIAYQREVREVDQTRHWNRRRFIARGSTWRVWSWSWFVPRWLACDFLFCFDDYALVESNSCSKYIQTRILKLKSSTSMLIKKKKKESSTSIKKLNPSGEWVNEFGVPSFTPRNYVS